MAGVRRPTWPVVVGDDSAFVDRMGALRALMKDAFGPRFSDEDWQHTFGGWRILVIAGDDVIGHAAVVPRSIRIDGRECRAGYVEGVAIASTRQGQGIGRAVMADVAGVLAAQFELGVLSTSRQVFYARQGWQRWEGPSWVLEGDTRRRTPEEDAGLMVLLPAETPIDVRTDIECESRPGDDW
jgi:aminoglycoside 2'-N-acetyltransferase I